MPRVVLQLMGLSLKGELRMEVKCATSTGKEGGPVSGELCHGLKGHQEWIHNRVRERTREIREREKREQEI